MSANVQSRKEEGNKDRRTRMVTSSVNAPVKKDGAGGHYTWGGAMDVKDYEPVGLGGMTKVITAAPAPVQVPVSQPMQLAPAVIQDTQQFPALGSTVQPTIMPATSARWAAPSAAVYAAPGSVKMAPGAVTQVTTSTVSAQKVVLNGDMLRAGVPALDAQHPRNAFARKPHKAGGGSAEQQIQEAPAIDWTASGTTAFQQQVIHAVAANPAHLGPYMVAKPAVPLSTLQAMPSPAAYIPNPKMSKQVNAGPQFGKPQVMFQRKC